MHVYQRESLRDVAFVGDYTYSLFYGVIYVYISHANTLINTWYISTSKASMYIVYPCRPKREYKLY